MELIRRHEGPAHPDAPPWFWARWGALGRYPEAGRSSQRALRIAEQSLGAESAEVSVILNNFAALGK